MTHMLHSCQLPALSFEWKGDDVAGSIDVGIAGLHVAVHLQQQSDLPTAGFGNG